MTIENYIANRGQKWRIFENLIDTELDDGSK